MAASALSHPRTLTCTIILVVLFTLHVLLNPSNVQEPTFSNIPRPFQLPIGPERIPSKIWQIFYGFSNLNSEIQRCAESWMRVNPTASYSRLGKEGALDFVQRHYSHRPTLVETYSNIRTPVLAADLLRYMILAAEGGVYSDIDTTALKPIHEWVPEHLQADTAAVVGIEYDRGQDENRLPGFVHDLQFCQWTIAAAPEHPMLQMTVEAVAEAIQKLADGKGVAIEDLQPTDWEVLTTTGPGIWSEMVFQSLKAATGRTIKTAEVSGLKEPRLFGDILVLPISGFAIGVPHSGGRSVDPSNALVKHSFHGSWRHH